MKRAYEYDRELIENAEPVILVEEEQTWEQAFEADEANWQSIKRLWKSNVPGSHAPERVILAGILSMYNMGYDVTAAEELIPAALDALERDDKITLTRLTARVFRILNTSVQTMGHPYLQYTVYDCFEQYQAKVIFDKYQDIATDTDEFYDRIYGGWVAQIIGAAVGTAIEGYTSSTIERTFGQIHDYIRKPSTYNDDITYELAFLEAFSKTGYDVSAVDIAEEWVSLIPSGWSAEDIALKNLQLGIFPPESGFRSNPFREWIGAQMRGAICGMVAPANPEQAARLAFKDGSISHHNNGIIGEVFNAVMCSIAFCERDMRAIVRKAIYMIPHDCEYYSVVDFAWEQCENTAEYMTAWKTCEKKYIEYNWIHAYPNAAAEVIALYFCENDFDTCLNMISMMGLDVDCNAAQIMTLFGVAYGSECISNLWREPINDELQSYVRGYEKTSIAAIAHKTVEAVNKGKHG